MTPTEQRAFDKGRKDGAVYAPKHHYKTSALRFAYDDGYNVGAAETDAQRKLDYELALVTMFTGFLAKGVKVHAVSAVEGSFELVKGKDTITLLASTDDGRGDGSVVVQRTPK